MRKDSIIHIGQGKMLDSECVILNDLVNSQKVGWYGLTLGQYLVSSYSKVKMISSSLSTPVKTKTILVTLLT